MRNNSFENMLIAKIDRGTITRTSSPVVQSRVHSLVGRAGKPNKEKAPKGK